MGSFSTLAPADSAALPVPSVLASSTTRTAQPSAAWIPETIVPTVATSSRAGITAKHSAGVGKLNCWSGATKGARFSAAAGLRVN